MAHPCKLACAKNCTGIESAISQAPTPENQGQVGQNSIEAWETYVANLRDQLVGLGCDSLVEYDKEVFKIRKGFTKEG